MERETVNVVFQLSFSNKINASRDKNPNQLASD